MHRHIYIINGVANIEDDIQSDSEIVEAMRVWELAGISGSLVSAQKGDFNQKLQYCLHCILLLSSISLCLTISCLVLSFILKKKWCCVSYYIYLAEATLIFTKSPAPLLCHWVRITSIVSMQLKPQQHHTISCNSNTIQLLYNTTSFANHHPPSQSIFFYFYLNMQ